MKTITLMLACGTAMLAQQAAMDNAKPAFEVASVKPADPLIPMQGIQPDGRTFNSDVTLGILIPYAYNVRGFQIVGAPRWVGSDPFTIRAKAPESTGDLTLEKIRPLVQALLADRFHLTFHREVRDLPVYELVVGKNGPTLAEGKDGAISPTAKGSAWVIRKGQFIAQMLPMSGLASALSDLVGRTVIDKTGLTGNYNFQVDWTPPMSQTQPQADDASRPSVFTALQERLGLKLQSGKGPVEVLVIDHVEQPSEN